MTYTDAAQTLFYEFIAYSNAYNKRQKQEQRDVALQAWLNQTAQATKKSGKDYKSVYKNFEDFYKQNLESKPTQDNKKLSMADRNRRINNHLGKEVSNGG